MIDKSHEEVDGMKEPSGSNAGDDFRGPCTRISRLTTLRFDAPSVAMRHDMDAIRYDVMPRLRKAGLLPSRGKLKGILSASEVRDLDPPAEDPGKPGALDGGSSIVELMGVYLPDRREVIVYDKMCKIVAAGLGLDVEPLKRVVAAHEVAHAVTHLGKDEKDRIWYFFDKALTEDKELFAQIYPLFHFRKVRDKQALGVFLKLADHQDDIYNLWRKHEHSDIEDVNDMLMEKRLDKADSNSEEGPFGLAWDGMETLVLTRWMERAQETIQSIQSRTAAGRIDKKDLEYLRGLIRFCADTIRKDLGPGSETYLKERYEYMQSDLASLKRSFTKMMRSTKAVDA